MISTDRRSRAARRRVLLPALVPLLVAALLLSVIVPAFETRRVIRLLQEISEIEPTRTVSSKIEQVAGHERQSLFVNAVLVMVALAAIGAVTSISRREQRLTALLQRRVEEESAMSQMSRKLSEAFTMDDVTRQIALSALDVTQARGAFVENIDSGPDGSFTLTVRGVAGTNVPPLGTSRAYAGSFTEGAIDHEGPALVTDFAHAYSSSPGLMSVDQSSPTIILPIKYSNEPIGALFIVGAARTQFRADDTGWARTIAHLAALAYEKVRLLDESREGRQALELAMKSRQRLMRGFTHDVKNPLGAADGYADLLSAGIYGELAGEQRESVQRIRRSIRRALDLIDDLHELARAETGNIALHREPVDIGELMRTSADEYRGAAFAAGLPLTVDVANDVPIVETDSVRVSQIVGNLLSNAIKYTRSGAVTLRVRSYQAAGLRKAQKCVAIDVIDTGLGIPADKQEQIFEEFSRLGTTDKPGAGLGLAISKRLAEALSGEITVKSEVGCGSTFTLRIPVSIQNESDPADAPQPVDDFHRTRQPASTSV